MCKAKYRRRTEENYDLEGSPTFIAWKKLYSGSKKSNASIERHLDGNVHQQNTQECTVEPLIETSAKPAVATSATHTRTVLKEILTYPTLEANGPPKRKNIKRSIPNFVSGPESMKILLDEKLKKARQVAEKQKKMVEVEKKKTERQERLKEDKIRKEQKKKEREESLKKKEDEKKKARNKRTKRKAAETNLASKAKKWRHELEYDDDENICNICLQERLSTDDENNPWLMCECCHKWMHVVCVPLSFDIPNEAFCCHECQE